MLKPVLLASLVGVVVLAAEAALFFRGDFARRVAADGVSFREATNFQASGSSDKLNYVKDAPLSSYLPFFLVSSVCRYTFLASVCYNVYLLIPKHPAGKLTLVWTMAINVAVLVALNTVARTLATCCGEDNEAMRRAMTFAPYLAGVASGCLVLYVTRYKYEVRNVWAVGAILLLIVILYYGVVLATLVPLFTESGSMTKLAIRVAVDLFKSVQIHVILWAMLRIRSDFLCSEAYHAFMIFTVASTALCARVLQVGATSLGTFLAVEAVSIALEMKEVFFFSKDMTLVDELVDVACWLGRVFNRIAPLKLVRKSSSPISPMDSCGQADTSANSIPHASRVVHDADAAGRRSKAFNMMILDLMIAEAVASILSLASFLIYQYAFDDDDTYVKKRKVVWHGLMSIFAELCVSDTIAIAYLSWKGAEYMCMFTF